jgi:NAD-dependent SIR2 family protein deacetylase
VKDFEKELAHASSIIQSCDAFLVGAGAGMGVDSGLPDFRGTDGFWKAYPSLQKVGIKFEDMANPRWFIEDPHLAWGFYGHRFNLYKKTQPHAGFAVINNWIKEKKQTILFLHPMWMAISKKPVLKKITFVNAMVP